MEQLIDPIFLKSYLHNKLELIIVDIRWYANAPGKGFKEWEAAHIPGAVFLDLDLDLSDQSHPENGRHPLPDPETFVNTLTKKGIGRNSIIVAYDDASGAIAARFWWMMRWIKGPEIKILNGGFQGWKYKGFPVESGSGRLELEPALNPIIPKPQNQMLVNKTVVAKEIESENAILLDARDLERYLGKFEPIDPVAGHIPGAINSPYKVNLTHQEIPLFQPTEKLHAHFEALGINSGEDVICYCGSGVTACHNILALEIAGFPGARLYPGSWSEWCRTDNP